MNFMTCKINKAVFMMHGKFGEYRTVNEIPLIWLPVRL